MQQTIYACKGKKEGRTLLFKYDLSGNLIAFEIHGNAITPKQIEWLYSQNWPWTERVMKEHWMRDNEIKAAFEIKVSPPDLSFEALWNLYDHKVKRVEAEKNFWKLSEADVIKCFLAIPGYNSYLFKKRTAKAHLSTFINQKYYLDDWGKAS